MSVVSDPNGIHCPACYSPGESCVNEITDCTGDQDHCFEMVSSTHIGGKNISVIMKGCATKNVCLAVEQGRASPITGSGLSLIQGRCTAKTSDGTQTNGFFFPTISGFLLMKMFL
uniref:Uncharacterized protein n=2 Tax=Sphaerodactylus townsendi TaxID=933632 RepID=A0ACB8FSF7_9SAUR